MFKRRITLGLGAIAAVALVAIAIRNYFPLCANESIQIVHSPSKQKRAVIFSRNCGATTGYNTQISIVDATENLANTPGNVFVSDSAQDYAKRNEAIVRWKADDELVINYGASARVFKSLEAAAGVKIIYEKASRPST